MVQRIVACRDKTPSLHYIMTAIITWSRVVFVQRMNLEVLEGVEMCNSVLPNIANYIEEITIFEHVYRAWRQPVF